MIEVTFYVTRGALSGFRVTGHSGSAPRGEDIICSAVSSAAYMTANTLIEVMKIPANVAVEDGFMEMTVQSTHLDAVQNGFHGLKLHFEQLAEQYPDSITIINGGVQHA